MNTQLEQIRKDIGATSDQQLADFIGVSRRSVCSLKEGAAASKRMQRLLDDASGRARSAHTEPARYAQSAHVSAVRETPPRFQMPQAESEPLSFRVYGAATMTAPRVRNAANIQALEDRLEHALEEILEVRKELRRMKT